MTYNAFDVAELIASAREYRQAVQDRFETEPAFVLQAIGNMLRARKRLDVALEKFPEVPLRDVNVDIGRAMAASVLAGWARKDPLFDPFKVLLQSTSAVLTDAQREELLAKFTETWEAFKKPPGCTCKNPMVWVLHDHHELEVDASCEAHKALWPKIRALETEEKKALR